MSGFGGFGSSTFGQQGTFGQPAASTTSFGTTSFGGAPAGTQLSDSPIQAGLPDDAISALSWSPTANFLTATSWDGTVRVWEVAQSSATSVAANPKAMQKVEGSPILSSCWQNDGSAVLLGGCDKTLRKWDLGSNSLMQIGQHDAPIRSVVWINQPQPMAVTGSWDKTLRFWDLRSPTAAFVHQLPERCYGVSTQKSLLVAATAGNFVDIINLATPNQVYRRLTLNTKNKEEECPLKEQIRCVSCVSDGEGFLIGSVEGRAASYYVNDPLRSAADQNAAKKALSFSFKCHRMERQSQTIGLRGGDSTVEVYAVNAIAPHPTQTHSLCTGGSDGTYQFWEKAERRKISSGTIMEPDPKGQSRQPVKGNNLPITAIEFNSTGQLMAYSHSYDWSKGHRGNNLTPTDPRDKPAIFVRVVLETDLKAVRT